MRSLVLSGVLAIGLSGIAFSAEVRTWSDKTGKFKVQAELIEVLKDKVALKKSDGKRVEIPLDKLSDADRKFVESLEEENPFKDAPASEPENPFQDAAPGEASAGSPFSAGGLPPQGKKKGDAWMAPDFSKLRRVPAMKKTDKNNWQLPALPGNTELAESVQFPKLTFHERVAGSAISPNGEWMALSTHEPWEGNQIFLLNLKEGQTVASMATGKPKDHQSLRPKVMAVSPDGKYLLTGADGHAHNNRDEAMQVTLWSVVGEELRPAMVWSPFDTGSTNWVDQDKSRPSWAGFADAKTLLLQAGGFIVKWDLTTGKPTYQVSLDAQSIKLTPDGTKLLAASNAALGVVDVALGKILYYKNLNASGSFDVSPDGTRILIHNGDTIEILDATTGDSLKSIRVEQGGPSYWAGNDHILAGQHALLDVENEFVCWNYTGQSGTFRAGGKLFFLTSDSQSSLLRSEDLPHPEALARIQEAQRDPSFFLLQPGASVNIDVQIPEQAAEIKTALIASLEKAGFKYSADAAMTFVCRKQVEKQEEVTIRDFGAFGGGGQKISFTPKSVFLELKEDGSAGPAVWTRSRRGWVPPIFNLKEGETTEAAVRRYEDPGVGFFSQVTFPKFIVRPGKAGETKLSSSGFGG